MRLRFQSVAGLAWAVTAAPACVLVLGDFDKGSAAATGTAGTGAVTSGGGDTTTGSDGGTATSSGGSVTGGRDVGGPSNDRGLGIAIDSQGNAVVTGYFGGAVDFGDGHPLTAAGSSDAFVAQYSPTGALNWVVQVGDTGAAMGSAVTVDVSDTVYVVGSFTNQFTFDASTTTGGPGIFLAKLDKSGAVQGSNGYFGSGLVQSPEAIAVSPDGTTIAVAGEVSGTLAIGGTMIQTAGDLDGFVFTVDSATGNTGWVQQVKDASGGDQSLYGVTIDVADGGVLWARSFGEVTAAGENAGVLHVALDPTSPLGASAVVGYFREQIDVGMGPVDTMGYYDAFFARLAP